MDRIRKGKSSFDAGVLNWPAGPWLPALSVGGTWAGMTSAKTVQHDNILANMDVIQCNHSILSILILAWEMAVKSIFRSFS